MPSDASDASVEKLKAVTTKVCAKITKVHKDEFGVKLYHVRYLADYYAKIKMIDEWGQIDDCGVINNGTTVDLHFCDGVYMQIPVRSSVRNETPPGVYNYLFGQGARVRMGKTNTCSGTVFALGSDGKYSVHVDNVTEPTTSSHMHFRDVIPETSHRYEAGKLLMVLNPKECCPSWKDAVVLNFCGLKKGNRHKLKLTKTRETIEMDLNRFNHVVQVFDSVVEFRKVREKYRTNLLLTRRRVIDSMTGRSLDIVKQTIKIGVTKLGQVTTGNTESSSSSRSSSSSKAVAEQNMGMGILAKDLCRESLSRNTGKFSSEPVLVRAAAGTGKSWGTQQLEYSLADSCKGFEGLPLVVRGQDLSNMVSRRGLTPTQDDGFSLIVQYIQVWCMAGGDVYMGVRCMGMCTCARVL